MKREVVTGFALGMVLALIVLMRIFLWPDASHYPTLCPRGLDCVLQRGGGGVVGKRGWSDVALYARLKFDPAVCSAPFVATLVDVTGIVIYFNVAWVLLRGTLL